MAPATELYHQFTPGVFLYLKQEDVKECGGMDMPATIEAVEKAFRLFDQGLVQESHVRPIHWGNRAGRRVAFHPSYIGGDVEVVGIKWIPSNPENPSKLRLPRSNALIILSDPRTGYPLAVVEGKLISDMRTGAVAGVGAKYLARSGAQVVGLIGGGPISRAHLMALYYVLPTITEIKVYDILHSNAERFVADMIRRLDISTSMLRVVDSAEEAVRDSDVIATATNVSVEESYLRYEWLRPGALLINTSVNDPTTEVVQRANLVVVDSRTQFSSEGTRLVEAARQGLLRPEEAVELGSIISGRHPGRRAPQDIILFSPLGMGMHDLINAKRVYDRARARGIGTLLRLWDAPEWF
jgi:2,3-diaminopropionate biosynthesis protein SbnB